MAKLHFYDEISKKELHQMTKAAAVQPLRYDMTQGKI